MEGQPRLTLKNIHKRFGSVVALSGVDFHVHAGEVVALVGDNGAGKSTLTKIMSGAYRSDQGEIIFDGVPVRFAAPEDASALGISAVYQDLALCENLDVVANLFLGREMGPSLPRPLRTLDENTMEARTLEVLRSLAVNLPGVRRPISYLSGGQRQAVAVSRAVLWGSKVVLLDEPTAALGVEQTAMVLRLVQQLRERGLAVVLISHNLSDVFRVSDRISVLRLGRRVAEFKTPEVRRNDVVAAITGGNDLQEMMP